LRLYKFEPATHAQQAIKPHQQKPAIKLNGNKLIISPDAVDYAHKNTLSIFTIDGKKIFTANITKKDDLSVSACNLTKGAYILRLFSEGTTLGTNILFQSIAIIH
jgi:hypothetical protein